MFLDLKTFSSPGDPQPVHPAAGRHRLHNGARHHGLGQVRGAIYSPNILYSKGGGVPTFESSVQGKYE